MLFSSSIFIFGFLPLAILSYYLAPKKFKNAVLVLFSLLFYSWGEAEIVAVMLASTLVDFFAGLLVEKGHRRKGLILSIVTNLSFLGFFKYFNFAFDNFRSLLNALSLNTEFFANVPHIALPIGISFYTFQTMSYTIDVYRGKVKANHSFIDFAAYVTMFPQLVAGPIVRYSDMENQLVNKNISLSNFGLGVQRFIIGLAKKMLLANSCAYIADMVFAEKVTDLSSFHAWLGVIAYSFQIYFDFSGYSDMAIGLGKILGFDFLENFNYPYIAKDIKDFWRRWHISLSSWFRDYLYIPLGGNRVNALRTYLNLTIVFFVTGLWHGASWNFVIWGLYHGLFLIIERIGFGNALSKSWAFFRHLYTLLVVTVGWVLFRSDNLGYASSYISKMFLFSEGDPSVSSYLNYFVLNTETFVVILAATIFSIPLKQSTSHLFPKVSFIPKAIPYIKLVFLTSLFFISAIYVISGTYNPFIYFRF